MLSGMEVAFGYQVECPVSLVLNHKALAQYQMKNILATMKLCRSLDMKSWRQNIQDDEGDWLRGVWPSPGAEDSVRLDQGGGCSIPKYV